MSSPFLQISSAEWIASNCEAFAVFDQFPVSPGHTLVVTKRAVATWFEASAAEQAAMTGIAAASEATAILRRGSSAAITLFQTCVKLRPRLGVVL